MYSPKDILKAFNAAKENGRDTPREHAYIIAEKLYQHIDTMRAAGLDISLDLTTGTSELGFSLMREHMPRGGELSTSVQYLYGHIDIAGEDRYPFSIGHFQSSSALYKSGTYLFLSTYIKDGMQMGKDKHKSEYFNLLEYESGHSVEDLHSRLIDKVASKSILKERMPNLTNKDGVIKPHSLKIQPKTQNKP